MKLYKTLSLPAPPKHFCDRIIDTQFFDQDLAVNKNQRGRDWYERPITRAQQNLERTYNKRFEIGLDWHIWVKDHIIDNYVETSSSITYDHGHCIPPHTDVTCDWRLIYLLQTGGEVATIFWQEWDHPFIRPRGCFVDNYDRLTELDRVVMQPGSWYLIRSDVLHSVENISGLRIAVHVLLDTLPAKWV